LEESTDNTSGSRSWRWSRSEQPRREIRPLGSRLGGLRGCDLFVQWCREIGCEIETDSIGNIFDRRPGKNPSLAPLVPGNHPDTQPAGGKFDGVLGVLAALEVVRCMDESGFEAERPVEMVN